MISPVVDLFAQERRHTILMTFASPLPAGTPFGGITAIDHLLPLPANTDANAESFISLVQPAAAIFTTPFHHSNYLRQLRKRSIPTFLMAGKIRRTFPFFKRYRAGGRNTLKAFTHIFVFDKETEAYLNQWEFDNVTADEHLPLSSIRPKDNAFYHPAIIEKFVGDEKFIFIGGNIDTGKDLEFVAHLANTNPALKCLLAPRLISKKHLRKIKSELKGVSLLYSECDANTDFSKVQNLVIDFCGSLSHIYRYGSCAYLGEDSHAIWHITEATACGLPTSFGPRMKHRILPDRLIRLGISQTVKTPEDLSKWVKHLESNPTSEQRINSAATEFVGKGIESAHRIYAHINSYL